MSKIEINNEIVLMRQAVRQSRVSVVRKLIKEVKLLRARKHGDERTIEKCKRKAERLAAEIAAVKKLKEDEISKFGITETRSLQEVLSEADSTKRIMARLANHKTLRDRISRFKEKFPVYEEHLGPGRKKMSKLERKAGREMRNKIRSMGVAEEQLSRGSEAANDKIEHEEANESSDEAENEESEDCEPANEQIDESARRDEDVKDEPETKNDSKKNDAEPGSTLGTEKRKSPSKKRKNDAPNLSVTTKPSEQQKLKKRKLTEEMCAESKKSKTIKVISEEATVKRFTDLIDEEMKSTEIVKEPTDEMTKLRKNDVPNLSVTTKPSEQQKLKKRKLTEKMCAESKKSLPIKVISEEATVKRFTDLIDEEMKSTEIVKVPTDEMTKLRKKEVEIEKQIDSFFMTDNGEKEYMSVVVPKQKIRENDEEEVSFVRDHQAERRKNYHEKNNKFFSKIDQPRRNDIDDKYHSNFHDRRRNVDGGDRGEKFPRKDFARSAKAAAKPDFEKKQSLKEEELHPSWAARKKQQEMLKQGFQGKKIIFDD